MIVHFFDFVIFGAMKQVVVFGFFSLVGLVSCNRKGCTDQLALNYDSNANQSDNSCLYKGCTDPESLNYNVDVKHKIGECIYNADKLTGKWNVKVVYNKKYDSPFYYTAKLERESNDHISIQDISQTLSYINVGDMKVNWLSGHVYGGENPFASYFSGSISSEDNFKITYYYEENPSDEYVYIEQYFTRSAKKD